MSWASRRWGRRIGYGGARRDRTADLLHAMQALSQLSYGPVAANRCNRKKFTTPRRLCGGAFGKSCGARSGREEYQNAGRMHARVWPRGGVSADRLRDGVRARALGAVCVEGGDDKVVGAG